MEAAYLLNDLGRATLVKGGELPALPDGYAFLIDHDGSYVVDDDGSYIIVEA